LKLASYFRGNTVRPGIFEGRGIIDIQDAAHATGVSMNDREMLRDITSIIRGGRNAISLFSGMKGDYPTVDLSSTRIAPPIPNPPKIIAAGMNFRDHAKELKSEIPATPIIFCKSSTSVAGPGDLIRWPGAVTKQVDIEVELAVVMAGHPREATRQGALDAIFGYTIINDVSARDIQFTDKQWFRAKSIDTFCPMGPWISTRDEIHDPQNLKMTSSVNGKIWQSSNTSEMIFGVVDLVLFSAQAMHLNPGDIIATGTPAGVGFSHNPQEFLKKGDVVTLEIEGLGALSNPVGGPF
jgi:2-keto-4-pentenoate hydratase/2-oxohepta-3-ene-1,7-dioic acid hydratase in catechol pathway